LEEERDRGITIRSSAALIGFLESAHKMLTMPWKHYPPPILNDPTQPSYFQIFDSPGHLDFSSEVTTCVALSNTAVLLVDVIEGVSLRTIQLLRHVITASIATNNFIIPIVVINKIDKLIATTDADQISNTLHAATTNILTTLTTLIASLLLPFQSSLPHAHFSLLEALWSLTPSTLLYGSGLSNYIFTLDTMSRFYCKHVNAAAATPATRITPMKIAAAADQGFCGYLANPPAMTVKRTTCPPPPAADGLKYRGTGGIITEWLLWSLIEDIVGILKTPKQAINMLDAHPLIPEGYVELLNKRDVEGKDGFAHIMSTWFPATVTTFKEVQKRNKMFRDNLPKPPAAGDEVSYLALRKAMPSSSFQVLPGSAKIESNTIVSIGRVYNAALVNGASMYIVGSRSGGERVSVRCFLPQCDSFFEVAEVPAGCICAVIGVEERETMKGCNKFNLMSVEVPEKMPAVYDCLVNADLVGTGGDLVSDPVIKIAVETVSVDDVGVLERGLRRLNMCDDDVSVSVTKKNEYIIAAAGETRLGVVVNDLNRMYCERKIEIKVTDVAVGLRETVGLLKWEGEGARVYESESVLLLEKNKQEKLMQANEGEYMGCFEGSKNGVVEVEIEGGGLVVLSVLPQVEGAPKAPNLEVAWVGKDNECACMVRGACREDLKASFVCAFEEATMGGLICNEPLHGVVCVLERWEGEEADFGPKVVGLLSKGIREAMMTRPVRVVESFVICVFQTNFGGLGDVYAVLSKRRGKVIKEESIEGTDLVTIECYVPMGEMKGLGGEMLEKTGGAAIGTGTRFSHWGVVDEDPFWYPVTQEDREEWGEEWKRGDNGGIWGTVLEIRKRKGQGSEMLVVAADKQRNLSRNK